MPPTALLGEQGYDANPWGVATLVAKGACLSRGKGDMMSGRALSPCLMIKPALEAAGCPNLHMHAMKLVQEGMQLSCTMQDSCQPPWLGSASQPKQCFL